MQLWIACCPDDLLGNGRRWRIWQLLKARDEGVQLAAKSLVRFGEQLGSFVPASIRRAAGNATVENRLERCCRVSAEWDYNDPAVSTKVVDRVSNARTNALTVLPRKSICGIDHEQ